MKIQRCDPSTEEASYMQEYRISVAERINVQDVLRDIYEKMDATLAFRNTNCYRGVCAGCIINVNGKRARACCTWVEPGDEITIGPAEGFPVVRDLVVELTRR
jgi:succinate dehydrogenase/fumarate reductase-like Fe-S protein